MRRFCLGVAALLALPGATALADGVPGTAGADAEASRCGAAYSFGEVVSSDERRGGPIVAVPDTLCPDLASSPATRIEALSIYVDGRKEDAVRRQHLRVPQPHKAPQPRY